MAIEGYVDGVVGSYLIGWAYDPEKPDHRLRLAVTVDETSLGTTVADLERSDLGPAGIGDGRHAFRVELPIELEAGEHVISVVEEESGTIVPVHPEYVTEGDSSADLVNLRTGGAPAQAVANPANQLQGYVDGIVHGEILGWAWNPDAPEARLTVQVAFDGEVLGTIVADRPRGDLTAHGIGDGGHAFAMPVSGPLEDGSEHTVIVTEVESGQVLPLSQNYHAELDDGGALVLRMAEHEVHTGPTEVDQEPGPVDADVSRESTSRGALLGRAGWLFDIDEPGSLERVLGTTPVGVEELQRLASTLRDRVTSMGDAPHLVFGLPDKAAVYWEHLPEGVGQQLEERPVASLARVLRDDTLVDLVDLLPALRDARRHGRTFLRQGSGLTWLGAFHGYRAVAKELRKMLPGIEAQPIDALDLVDLVDAPDDLRTKRRFVKLDDSYAEIVREPDGESEREPDLAVVGRSAMYARLPADLQAAAGPGAAMLESQGEDGQPLLVLDPGAASRIVSFLAEHFSRTVVVRTPGALAGTAALLGPCAIVEILPERDLAEAIGE